MSPSKYGKVRRTSISIPEELYRESETRARYDSISSYITRALVFTIATLTIWVTIMPRLAALPAVQALKRPWQIRQKEVFDDEMIFDITRLFTSLSLLLCCPACKTIQYY
jgi:hypothetical protein